MSVVQVVIGIASLCGVLQASPSLLARDVIAMMVGPSLSGTGGSPHSRRPAPSLSCRYPPSRCMSLVVGLRHPRFSCFYSDFRKWHCGDRSHASSIPIADWSMVCPVISSCLPLMVLLTVSIGDLAAVTPGSQRSVVALVLGVPASSGASYSAPALRW
jgi:hypothetical protein